MIDDLEDRETFPKFDKITPITLKMHLENINNKITPFVRKGKRFTVIISYTSLPNINNTSKLHSNSNVFPIQNCNFQLSKDPKNKNLKDIQVLNNDRECSNLYNKIDGKRRGRSLSSQGILDKNREKTVIRRRAKSQIPTEYNKNDRDINHHIKIFNKMEHYDNITSRVYNMNEKYRPNIQNKNDSISKEALINIKYKMNQQLEKEKEKSTKLKEDNNKLQDKIKYLEKRIKEMNKKSIIDGYTLSLPQINDLKQKNKILTENIEKQKIMMKMYRRRTLLESKKNSRTIKDLEKSQELSTRKINNLVNENENLKNEKNHLENIIDRYKSKSTSKLKRSKSYIQKSNKLKEKDNDSDSLIKSKVINSVSKIPKYVRNSNYNLSKKKIK
ncbi:hypothetical protein BCR32DRAFT_265521, partial [Anaeromyces robustus]